MLKSNQAILNSVFREADGGLTASLKSNQAILNLVYNEEKAGLNVKIEGFTSNTSEKVIGDIVYSLVNPGSDYLKLDRAVKLQADYSEIYNIIGHDYKKANKASIVNLPTSATWHACSFDENIICAVGYNSSILIYSEDGGETWSQGTMPVSAAWCRGKYIDFLNIHLMISHENSSVYVTSTDGKNWTQRALPVAGNWHDIFCSGDKIFICGLSTNVLLCSEDGINWSQITLSNARNWKYGTYGNGYLIMNSPEGYFCYSDDNGVTWQEYFFGSQNTGSIRVFENKFYMSIVGTEYLLVGSTPFNFGYQRYLYSKSPYIFPSKPDKFWATWGDNDGNFHLFDKNTNQWGSFVLPNGAVSYTNRICEEYKDRLLLFPSEANFIYIIDDTYDAGTEFRLPNISNAWIKAK